jgi:enterochelin esterase family protein
LLALFLANAVSAQDASPKRVIYPDVSPDRKITFRVRAESAKSVTLQGTDIPDAGGARSPSLKRDNDGVWSVTVGPLPPGAYRYSFEIDGVFVLDPVNTKISEANMNLWSLVHVPGNALYDQGNVPHGAMSEIHYYSNSLKRERRMHVYTPPGYETGKGTYPVFYLLHGAYDNDDAWSTVGCAGNIFDNLIAEGKAKPMVVVMPDGHTGPFNPADPYVFPRHLREFVDDFTSSIRPYVEKNYRLKPGPANRAIAGLSMGGNQTLDVAFRSLSDYGYIGVFSSGVLEMMPQRQPRSEPKWEERNAKALGDKILRKNLKLFWFGIGKTDFLLKVSNDTVSMLRGHGFQIESIETEGGHTWLNWRDYLSEFAPRLFR